MNAGCKFYGCGVVAAGKAMLVDSQGNQCALVLDAFAPCAMEVYDHLEPHLATCPRAAANGALVDKLYGLEKHTWSESNS